MLVLEKKRKWGEYMIAPDLEELNNAVGKELIVSLKSGYMIHGILWFIDDDTKYGYKKKGFFVIGDRAFKARNVENMMIVK